ncbi:MAG: TolC family outer membrane protein [Natronospirillum sp.]|uniref:TolC family outer membrane protein n=1 Tax=Natronospirillum sp. TaxID=2812955 RepID=UPI0025CBE933|nr:TolC family outer membrane protein [Natronospirillum sp.]MCH8552285.1 TolC family outer membrane protein [Natronospirillum sp.]
MYRKNWILAGMIGLCSLPLQAQSLEELYRAALRNDTTLSASLSNARATDTRITEGRAALLPRLSLEGETGAEYRRSADGFPGLDEDGLTEYSAGAALVLSQNIFNRQAISGYQAVQLMSRQSEAQVEAARASLLQRVVDAYLDVLKAREGVTLSERVIETVERQLEQTQERYDVGLVAITDVLEATATLDQSRADLLQAQNGLALAQQNLSRITGVEIEDLPRLGSDFNPSEVAIAELEQWLALSRQNPEVVAGRFGIRASEEERTANRSDLFPVVSAQARYGYNASYIDDRMGGTNPLTGEPNPIDDFQDGGNFSISLTATLSIPVYDGGSRRAGLDRSGYQIEAQQAQLDGQIQQTELAVRQFHQQVQADLSRIQALQQVVSSRESAAEATELGYEVGSRNVVEVLNAQQALLNAQTDLSNARHNFLSNYFQLKEAAGDLRERDIQWLNEQLTRR